MDRHTHNSKTISPQSFDTGHKNSEKLSSIVPPLLGEAEKFLNDPRKLAFMDLCQSNNLLDIMCHLYALTHYQTTIFCRQQFPIS